MTDTNLESRLEGLFSNTGLEPEPEAKQAPLQSEEAIIDFLVGKAEPAATAEPTLVEVPPHIPQKRLTRVHTTLLYSVIILGGVLFVILLVRLLWQRPITWPGSRALYSAGYTMALVITLIQWMFGLYLSKVLRGAEEQQAKTIRSQAFLTERIGELATRIARLQRNALQWQTAAQVAQAAAAVLDPGKLAQQVVEMVCERFDLYYVGLFLIDESGQWAVLRAGTGEAGRQMLAQGHRLRVGDTSMIGGSTASAQVRIVPDPSSVSRQSPAEVNPLLPKARSEVVLPLKSRGRAIGALDVQSTDRQAFSQEDVAVLQTVADQTAVTIDNAQLLAALRAKLEEMEASQRRASAERWAYSLSAQAASSYERARPGVTPLDDATTSQDASEIGQAIERALARQEIVIQSDTGDGTGQATLVAPISLRGEVLGALGLHEPGGERWWTDDEVALIEALADQMALAIENARLLAETRQYAERERLIADISTQVRASTNVETILRTAIRELGRALRASDGLIQLGASEDKLAPSTGSGQATCPTTEPAKGVVDDDGADA